MKVKVMINLLVQIKYSLIEKALDYVAKFKRINNSDKYLEVD